MSSSSTTPQSHNVASLTKQPPTTSSSSGGPPRLESLPLPPVCNCPHPHPHVQPIVLHREVKQEVKEEDEDDAKDMMTISGTDMNNQLVEGKEMKEEQDEEDIVSTGRPSSRVSIETVQYEDYIENGQMMMDIDEEEEEEKEEDGNVQPGPSLPATSNVEVKVKVLHFNCTESNCNVKLDSMAHLYVHLGTVHGLAPLQCFAHNCNARFDYPRQVRDHIKLSHSRNTRFECAVCNKECDSQKNANNHWYFKHLTAKLEGNL